MEITFNRKALITILIVTISLDIYIGFTLVLREEEKKRRREEEKKKDCSKPTIKIKMKIKMVYATSNNNK